ncbi:hypothetical protein ACJX0J_006926, partial [Zea mays]
VEVEFLMGQFERAIRESVAEFLSGDRQEEKLPKCEQVDYGSEVEGCADDENPGKRAALVTLVGNEYCGDEDERVQVLTIVKKDEPADDIIDRINPGTVAGYSEAKGAVGASAATSAVRPAGSRSSSFHGVTRWSGKYEAHLWDSSCKLVRTQTLAIIQVDAAPFKQWYLTHYGFLWYGKKLMVSFRNHLSCCFLLGYSIISSTLKGWGTNSTYIF